MESVLDPEALLRDGALQIRLQPVVTLATGRVVGHAALARFPAGPAWRSRTSSTPRTARTGAAPARGGRESVARVRSWAAPPASVLAGPELLMAEPA